jgi:hypothetical protein
MSGYSDMQTRIADEIARTDLTSQIQLAILSAVRHYAKERWYFTETSTTFSTVASTQTYALPSDFKAMERVTLTYPNNSFWDLTYRPFEYIGRITSISTLTGPPQDYAIYSQQLWLYPIPGDVYTITEYYEQEIASLSATPDNAWMVDGEELIRSRAKADIYENVIRDVPDDVAAARGREADAYAQLRSSSTTRTAQGRVLPQFF